MNILIIKKQMTNKTVFLVTNEQLECIVALACINYEPKTEDDHKLIFVDNHQATVMETYEYQRN